MKNPFRFERPHSAKQLLGREVELDRIVEAATHGGRVFVSGERGVGKTSLLEAAVSRIKEEKKALPIFIGLRDLISVETLVEMILVAVAQTARGEKKVVPLLNTYFGFLNPEPVGYDQDGKVWRIKHVYFTGRGLDDFTNLTGILGALDHFALRLDLKVALILDDAEELRNYFAKEEIDALVGGIQGHYSRIAAVLAYTPEKNRVDRIFKSMEMTSEALELYPLLAEDGFQLFSRSFKKIGCGIQDDARYEFERLGYGSPFFLLTVASRLWDKLASLKTPKPVSKAMILEMVDEITDSLEPYFAARWRELTLTQRQVVNAVIHEDDSTLFTADVLSRYRVSGATMERELHQCENLGVLTRDDTGGSVSWSVPDEFFRRWLEKTQFVVCCD